MSNFDMSSQIGRRIMLPLHIPRSEIYTETNSLISHDAIKHGSTFTKNGEGQIVAVFGPHYLVEYIDEHDNTVRIGMTPQFLGIHAQPPYATLKEDIFISNIPNPEPMPPKKKKKDYKKLLSSLIVSEEVKDEIVSAISALDNNDIIFTKWGFSKTIEYGKASALLFYGLPGCGKTMAAKLIAKALGKTLKPIGAAEIETMEPGGAERAIISAFEEAQRENHVLFFDECDSLVSSRENMGQIMAAQVNQLLTSLEHYDGVVIFATNRIEELDSAIERRLTAKIEFPLPDLESREKIYKSLIPKKAPLAKDVSFRELAQFEMSGGHIKNVVLNGARIAVSKNKKRIARKHFMEAVQREIKAINAFKQRKSPNRPRLSKGRSATANTTS